ncbi:MULTISPECIES: hypothetical protein [unclassified Streptomyces]|uniref:hypothetical protein n=1 Tax=unclassified Streptomyces TaxID=2593676 RepID=UPI0034313D1A
MNNMKRVLAAVALTGAVLSCSGVAQAQETKPVDSGPAKATDSIIDVLGEAFVTILNKQAEGLIGNLLRGNG